MADETGELTCKGVTIEDPCRPTIGMSSLTLSAVGW